MSSTPAVAGGLPSAKNDRVMVTDCYWLQFTVQKMLVRMHIPTHLYRLMVRLWLRMSSNFRLILIIDGIKYRNKTETLRPACRPPNFVFKNTIALFE